MKNIKKILSVLFLLLIFVQVNAQDRPNVIMIVLDDLNDYLGAMDGHPQAITPNLDKLANVYCLPMLTATTRFVPHRVSVSCPVYYPPHPGIMVLRIGRKMKYLIIQRPLHSI